MDGTKYFLGESEITENLAELIERIASEDESALAEFYDRTINVVHGLAQRMVKDPATAEEVTLDAYLQVWRQAGEYSETCYTPMTWLIMMARSRAVTTLRLEGRLDLNQAIGPATIGHEFEAIHGRQAAVQSALNTLTSSERNALEMAFFEGLGYTALAEKLGVPLDTVRVGIQTGSARIREHLRLPEDASFNQQPASYCFGVRTAIRRVRNLVSEWADSWRSQKGGRRYDF